MDKDIVPSFVCPISSERFEDPVVTCDGHTYNRTDIERWLRERQTSPNTNLALATAQLIPNHALRKAMEECMERDVQEGRVDPACLEITQQELGAGSFGRVWAGWLRIGRTRVRVAVKRVDMPGAEQEAVERELRAHRHAAKHCSGVCLLFGSCQQGGRLCIVMKQYERSLRRAIDAGPLDDATVCRWAHTLFRALEQLHGSGLVVRDIKPENILLDWHGEVVLSDFGISAVLGTRSIVESSIKGTFNYMAPEAFELGPTDSPRDIWSMACVVAEMCTGNIPWKDMQMQQIMRAVCDHRRVPDVPDAAPAADMLRRCFAFDKARRPTAGEMVSSMRQMHSAAAMRGPAEGSRILSERQCEELRAENDQLRVNLQQVTDAQAGLELRLRGQHEREKRTLEQQVESLRVQLEGSGQRRSGMGAWIPWLIVVLLSVWMYSQEPRDCLELKFASKHGDLAAVKHALNSGVRADCGDYWVRA